MCVRPGVSALPGGKLRNVGLLGILCKLFFSSSSCYFDFIALLMKSCPAGLHSCCLKKKNADYFLLLLAAHQEACIFHPFTHTNASRQLIWYLYLWFISQITIKSRDQMDIAWEVQSWTAMSLFTLVFRHGLCSECKLYQDNKMCAFIHLVLILLDLICSLLRNNRSYTSSYWSICLWAFTVHSLLNPGQMRCRLWVFFNKWWMKEIFKTCDELLLEEFFSSHSILPVKKKELKTSQNPIRFCVRHVLLYDQLFRL